MSYVNEFPHGRMWDSDLRQILEMYNTVKGLPNNWEEFKNQLNGDWNELRNFVTIFFAKLDVQEEINNKIDELVADGTIEAMLQEEFNAYTTEINSRMGLLEARMNTFTALPNEATTGDAEVADARIDYNGISWDNVGEHIRGVSNQLSSEIVELQEFVNQLDNTLLRGVRFEDGFYINANGALIEEPNWCYSKDYIPIEIGIPYTFIGVGSNVLVCYYNENYEFKGGYTAPTTNGNFSFTVSETEDAARFVRFSILVNKKATFNFVSGIDYVNYFNALTETAKTNKTDIINIEAKLSNNLLVGVNWVDGYINSNGDIIAANGWQYSDDYITVTANKRFSFIDIGNSVFICYYDENKEFIGGFTATATDGKYSLIVPDTVSYFRVSIYNIYITNAKFIEGVVYFGIEDCIEVSKCTGKTIYVGTGKDFTTITSALEYANENPNTTIIITDGTYDIVSEYGGELSGKGLRVGNGTKMIFSPNSNVICNYTGADESIMHDFSPFNAGVGDFEVVGLNITCSNVRYCFHDELGGASGFYSHTFRNCNMYLDNSNNTAWSANQCIGGGLGKEGRIIIEGGVYETVNPIERLGVISYHNGYVEDAKSEIVIKDVYIKGDEGTIRFGWYGASTLITNCYVSNCSVGVEPVIRAEDSTNSSNENMCLYAWNNEVRNQKGE